MRQYQFWTTPLGDNMAVRIYRCDGRGNVVRMCMIGNGYGLIIRQTITRSQAAREMCQLRQDGCTMNVQRSYCAAN